MSIPSIGEPHKRLTALSYANRLWESMDTPVSLSCCLMAKYHEYEQLVNHGVDPSHYIDPMNFTLDYQAVKLLSKYPFLETGIDTEHVAKRKFIEAEVRCRETNTKFRDSIDHLSGRVGSVFFRAIRKVAFVLGDVPSLEALDFSFGPGAAYGVRGDTSVYKKVSSPLECTTAFTDVLQEFLEEFPGWFPPGTKQDVSLVPGSQLIIVPKNAKTGRPICIEPLLNGLYQKGVGSWIRKRLKLFGVDLNDQGVNQKLASVAHVESLATVDFSSASDMISYMLVLNLLPIDWFEFLNVARCPRYESEGSWYNFHKFTSMGNAYTFELESLIFYALACACCEEMGVEYSTGKNLSVYGDDVIIPRVVFDLFSEVAVACGFVVSEEKSFSEGQFFESCGHDYFMGNFVRPLILQKKLNKLPAAFYAANSIKRIQRRLPQRDDIASSFSRVDTHKVITHRLSGVYDWVVGCIPPQFRTVGPEGYGDGHLISPLSSRAKRHPSWDGWWFRTYVEQPVRVKLDECCNAYALYYTRGRSYDYVEYPFMLSKILEESACPISHGSGYEVRGRTSLRLVKVVCHFMWNDLEDSRTNDEAPRPVMGERTPV